MSGSMIGGAILPFCLSTFGMMYVSYLSNQAAFVATALAKTEWYLLLGKLYVLVNFTISLNWGLVEGRGLAEGKWRGMKV